MPGRVLTVELPEGLAEGLERIAQEAGESTEQAALHAIEHAVRLGLIHDWLRSCDEQFGAVPPATLEAIRQQWTS